MASTIQLGTTLDYCSRFIYNVPFLFSNDGALAFSMADEVRQFILAPPFGWRWNRASVSDIKLLAGTSDVVLNLPDFGWLEKAWIVTSALGGESPKTHELTVMNNMSAETAPASPRWISAVSDDNNGNITFRVFGLTDTTHTLYMNYQRCARKFVSTADTWYPVPDYFSFLYNQGFLAKAYEYKGDMRFAFAQQQFLRQVLAANDGLSDAQKNLFLETRLITGKEQQSAQQKGQISGQGRAGY